MKAPKRVGPRLQDGSYRIVCDVCGDKFRATNTTQRYCSPECYEDREFEFKHSEPEPLPSLVRVDVVEPEPGPSWKPVSVSRLFSIFERDEFQCAYCGRTSIEHGVVLHADHIYPRSKGGPDTAENLITACKDCNLSKSATPLSPSMAEKLVARARRANERAGIQHLAVFKTGRSSSSQWADENR